jgi:hypothetical protein
MLDRRAELTDSNLPEPLQPHGDRWRNNEKKSLSNGSVAAIVDAMRALLEKDLALGTAIGRLYCDACQQVRSAAGFVSYGRYNICNRCATEYEVANARGKLTTVGQFVRDKNFGETAGYALDSILTR